MSLSQFIQALSALPQIVDAIKKMGEEEKLSFVEKLGLEDEEKTAAYDIITCFQENRPLNEKQQAMAQSLLDKAMQMNGLDLSTILSLNMNKS